MEYIDTDLLPEEPKDKVFCRNCRYYCGEMRGDTRYTWCDAVKPKNKYNEVEYLVTLKSNIDGECEYHKLFIQPEGLLKKAIGRIFRGK